MESDKTIHYFVRKFTAINEDLAGSASVHSVFYFLWKTEKIAESKDAKDFASRYGWLHQEIKGILLSGEFLHCRSGNQTTVGGNDLFTRRGFGVRSAMPTFAKHKTARKPSSRLDDMFSSCFCSQVQYVS